ncbi:hypothetical protein N7490_011241 [Penicillium lividum]|nr:hypothetical protein N7490_011241 [Penicillium lividum]
MTYDEARSQPRERILSGIPYHSEDATSHFATHLQTALSLPEPQTNGHHEVRLAYAPVHQIPHPPPYNFNIFPSESRKRARSASDEDHHHRNMTPPQPIHLTPLDGSAPVPESDMMFPLSDHSSHASSNHGYASPMPLSLPLPVPQRHHHHQLPSRARNSSSGMQNGPPSVVGQPGMPPPAPRPKGPKLKFTPREDSLLVELKEEKNLTWKQVADFFPGRTSGTLQVRYCTKLKAKDVVWTDELVERLQLAIKSYEFDRWRIISNKVGSGYTPAACKERAKLFPPMLKEDDDDE